MGCANVGFGYGVFVNVISDTDSAGRVATFLASVVEVAKIIFPMISSTLVDTAREFKKFAAFVFDVLDVHRRAFDWIKDGGPKTILSTIGLASITFFRTFGFLQFLQRMQLINFSAFVDTVGSIPVFGAIVSINLGWIGVAGLSSDILERLNQSKDRQKKADDCHKVAELYKELADRVDALDTTGDAAMNNHVSSVVKELASFAQTFRSNTAERNSIDRLINTSWEAFVEGLGKRETNKKTLKAALQAEETRWKNLKVSYLGDKSKNQFTMVARLAKLVSLVVKTWFAVSFSPLALALIGTAAYGIDASRMFYNKARDGKPKSMPEIIEHGEALSILRPPVRAA